MRIPRSILASVLALLALVVAAVAAVAAGEVELSEAEAPLVLEITEETPVSPHGAAPDARPDGEPGAPPAP